MPEGAVVVFSAHGVAPSVHVEAAQRPADDRRDLPAGHQGARRGAALRPRGRRHPADRPRGPRGGRRHNRARRPTASISSRARTPSPRLEVRDPAKVAWLSQTTLSVDETQETVAALRERFPLLADPPSDDICYATQNRQVAVKEIAAALGSRLVVGSTNSSNSVRLVEVALGQRRAARRTSSMTSATSTRLARRCQHGRRHQRRICTRVAGRDVLGWLAERGSTTSKRSPSVAETPDVRAAARAAPGHEDRLSLRLTLTRCPSACRSPAMRKPACTSALTGIATS